jgi:hypothetical protein
VSFSNNIARSKNLKKWSEKACRALELERGIPQLGTVARLKSFPSHNSTKREVFTACQFHRLEFFVELASGAGDEDSTGNTALAILHPLYDARGLAALGAIRTLGCVHDFLTICGFRNLYCHLLLSLT